MDEATLRGPERRRPVTGSVGLQAVAAALLGGLLPLARAEAALPPEGGADDRPGSAAPSAEVAAPEPVGRPGGAAPSQGPAASLASLVDPAGGTTEPTGGTEVAEPARAAPRGSGGPPPPPVLAAPQNTPPADASPGFPTREIAPPAGLEIRTAPLTAPEAPPPTTKGDTSGGEASPAPHAGPAEDVGGHAGAPTQAGDAGAEDVILDAGAQALPHGEGPGAASALTAEEPGEPPQPTAQEEPAAEAPPPFSPPAPPEPVVLPSAPGPNDSWGIDGSPWWWLGIEEIHGDAESNGLAGFDYRNRLDGALGDDTLWSGDGDDTARGGPGDDRIMGEAGRDDLAGDEGADVLFGGEGQDRLAGGAGPDTLLGGSGWDWMHGGTDGDLLWGGEGGDGISFAPGAGHDTVADYEPSADWLTVGDGVSEVVIRVVNTEDALVTLRDRMGHVLEDSLLLHGAVLPDGRLAMSYIDAFDARIVLEAPDGVTQGPLGRYYARGVTVVDGDGTPADVVDLDYGPWPDRGHTSGSSMSHGTISVAAVSISTNTHAAIVTDPF
jgi:hypothetical protein